jgi:hypothetical protein
MNFCGRKPSFYGGSRICLPKSRDSDAKMDLAGLEKAASQTEIRVSAAE